MATEIIKKEIENDLTKIVGIISEKTNTLMLQNQERLLGALQAIGEQNQRLLAQMERSESREKENIRLIKSLVNEISSMSSAARNDPDGSQLDWVDDDKEISKMEKKMKKGKK